MVEQEEARKAEEEETVRLHQAQQCDGVADLAPHPSLQASHISDVLTQIHSYQFLKVEKAHGTYIYFFSSGIE